jgi:hypothetical protein
MLRNGKWDVIENLEERFNETCISMHKRNCYKMGQKAKLMNFLKSAKDHMISVWKHFLQRWSANHYKKWYYRIQG